MHPAGCRVIDNGVMLRAAIVPKRNRVLTPAKAALEFGFVNVAIEKFEQRIAFIVVEFFEMRREVAIDKEYLAPVLWVNRNDRMLDRRCRFMDALQLIQHAVIAVTAPRKRHFEIMNRGQITEKPFHMIGQGFISRIEIGKHGVAAGIGNFQTMQDRSLGRRGRVG